MPYVKLHIAYKALCASINHMLRVILPQQAAQESKEEVEAALKGADMVFVTVSKVCQYLLLLNSYSDASSAAAEAEAAVFVAWPCTHASALQYIVR